MKYSSSRTREENVEKLKLQLEIAQEALRRIKNKEVLSISSEGLDAAYEAVASEALHNMKKVE